MPRKKSSAPAAPDNSGFDVPSSVDQPPPSSQLPASQPSTKIHQPSPINSTPIVKVPKHAFLHLQRMQTEKAKQEQLRQLARRYAVVRDLVKELEQLRIKAREQK